jgi:hypothetical protein
MNERLQMPNPVGVVAEEYQAFALPAVYGDYLPMVEFRLKTGDRVALAYAWLTAVKFHPERIELSFTTGAAVTIRGRNLTPIYSALARHQAVYVHEADAPMALLVSDSASLVDAIEVITPA